MSCVWPPVLLVFALCVYFSGREEPLRLLALSGILVMIFALVTLVGWLVALPLHGGLDYLHDYPYRFFLGLNPIPRYYSSGWIHVNPNTFVSAIVLLSIAFGWLGTSLFSLRRSRISAVIASVISVLLVAFSFVTRLFPEWLPLAIAVFLALSVLGSTAVRSTRSLWPVYASAAGISGVIISILAYLDVAGFLFFILFAAWCVVFFMFGLSLYRSREGAPDSAAQPPMPPPNQRVDNWAPTMHRPQW